MPDSDDNGISDGDEDFDEDTLTNANELNGITNAIGITYKTDPLKEDGDDDGLTDKEELEGVFWSAGSPAVYPDPTKEDSDEDDVNDGLEVEMGTNPCVHDSTFSRTMVADVREGALVTPSVSVSNITGEQASSLKISEVKNDYFLNSEIPGYIDSAFDFNISGGVSDENPATISFTMPNMSSEAKIYYWNEKDEILEPLTCTRSGNTVSASVTHFSKYILLNGEEFDSAFTEVFLPENRKPVDIMFAIYRGGNLVGDPDGYAEAMKNIYESILDKLKEGDRVGLVFGDSGFTQFYRGLADVTDEDAGLFGIIPRDDFFITGPGTELFSGQYVMLDIAMKGNDSSYIHVPSPTKTVEWSEGNDRNRYMIVISDGSQTELDENAGSELNGFFDDLNGKIITFAVGDVNEYKEEVLRSFTDDENYFSVSPNYDVIFEEMFPDDVDLTIDSNHDGISDYYTKLLFTGELKDQLGKKIFGNATFSGIQYNDDYDDDGLKNGEEVKITDNNGKITAKVLSDPIKSDSDGDKINDKNDRYPLIPAANSNIFAVTNDFYGSLKYIDDFEAAGKEKMDRTYNRHDFADEISFLEYARLRAVYCGAAVAAGGGIGGLAGIDAGLNLEYFLFNSGKDRGIDVSGLITYSSGKKWFETNINRARVYAESVLKDRESIMIASKFDENGRNQFVTHDHSGGLADFNWIAALGTSSGGVVASIARDKDSYLMMYRYIVYDLYDWEIDDDNAFITGLKNSDMYRLHNVGWARSYYIYSEYFGMDNWEASN